jgi:hypothetical protein
MEKLYYEVVVNGKIIHKEVDYKVDQARCSEIRSELWALTDDEFDALVKIIDNYVRYTNRSTDMALRKALRQYGIHATPKEAEMWYCFDEV